MQHRLQARSHVIYTIAVIGFIFTLHLAVPVYSNSSFLNLFMDEDAVGYIYMLGSAVSILGFLIAPHFIRRFGNYAVSIFLICVQIALFYGLISATSPITIATLFILQSAVVVLIGLSFDIFLEVNTTHTHVGAVRGLYATTLNASWVLAPLIGSFIINGTENYRQVYIVGLAMLFPLLYLVYRNFPTFRDPSYSHLSPWQLIRHVSSNSNWVKLFCANIVLQVFYAWMVVYSPIYLHKVIGLDWSGIGIILTIMLIPFVLIQYPLGKLADQKYGEKEIMALGFVVMGVSTIALSFITEANVALWALGLFLTRIGAAAAEIMLETYFFKTVAAKDSAVLGSFRITRPAAYFIAPFITTIGLMFTTHQHLFVILGVFCFLALYPALTIKDTK
jgi:MFS family permease